MTHFHLMRTQKHKILSIIVLNMAKYTLISFILIDFVPIFSTCFEEFLGGHSASKKSQVQKSPKFKKVPTPPGGGGHFDFGPSPKFPRFFVWKTSLTRLQNLKVVKLGKLPPIFHTSITPPKLGSEIRFSDTICFETLVDIESE